MKEIDDWTQDETGRSNSSPEYLALVKEVEGMIRMAGWALLNNGTNAVARSIVSHLAYTHNFNPGLRIKGNQPDNPEVY